MLCLVLHYSIFGFVDVTLSFRKFGTVFTVSGVLKTKGLIGKTIHQLKSIMKIIISCNTNAHLHIFVEACALGAGHAALLWGSCPFVDLAAWGGWGWRLSAWGGQGLHAGQHHPGHSHVSCQTAARLSQRAPWLLKEKKGNTLEHERHLESVSDTFSFLAKCAFKSCTYAITSHMVLCFCLHFSYKSTAS